MNTIFVSNEFKLTGIKGKNISWRQDVLPLLNQLKEAGINMNVSRGKYQTNKGHAYFYEVITYDGGDGCRKYFKTKTISAVWTFLLGIRDSEKHLPRKPELPKRDGTKCVVPSLARLNDLIEKAIFKGLDDEERDQMQYFDSMLEEAYATGRLVRVEGPPDWGIWAKNVQFAILDSENRINQVCFAAFENAIANFSEL